MSTNDQKYYRTNVGAMLEEAQLSIRERTETQGGLPAVRLSGPTLDVTGTVRRKFVPGGEAWAEGTRLSSAGATGASVARIYMSVGGRFSLEDATGGKIFDIALKAGNDDQISLDIAAGGAVQ